ncbi:MAG: hypothetical protein ACRDU4_14960 [Mycobacterium sp.]
MSPPVPEANHFSVTWNALPRRARAQIRRQVRLGRAVADPELADVAAGYASFQASRVWQRLFWLWFVPGLVLALGVAGQIHPVVIGVVLAMGAQAAYAHRNLAKAARAARADRA